MTPGPFPNTDLEPLETMLQTEQPDPVNSPHHYRTGGMETIDVLEAKLSPQQFRGFCVGNALKYLTRHNYKGTPEQDIRKAHWYLERLIEFGLRWKEVGEALTGENEELPTLHCIARRCQLPREEGEYCAEHSFLCLSNKEREDLRAVTCIFPGCRQARGKGAYCHDHNFLDGQPTQEDQ